MIEAPIPAGVLLVLLAAVLSITEALPSGQKTKPAKTKLDDMVLAFRKMCDCLPGYSTIIDELESSIASGMELCRASRDGLTVLGHYFETLNEFIGMQVQAIQSMSDLLTTKVSEADDAALPKAATTSADHCHDLMSEICSTKW